MHMRSQLQLLALAIEPLAPTLSTSVTVDGKKVRHLSV